MNLLIKDLIFLEFLLEFLYVQKDNQYKRKNTWFNGTFFASNICRSQNFRSKNQTRRIFKAALLFAAIFGFTAMSEKLARLSKKGPEEVNRMINRFFDQLIEIIYKWTETKLAKLRIEMHISLTNGTKYFQELRNNFFIIGKTYLLQIQE